MCTVTVHRTTDTLLLTMNRDEARTRGAEIPPMRHQDDNAAAWIAPADSDKGGTWCALNRYGIAACLLNRYQDQPVAPPPEMASRGTIIPALMTATSVAEAQDVLASGALRLEDYPPFTLVMASLDAAVRLDWSGTAVLEEHPVDAPWHLVTSSFFDPETVLPWRQEAFDAWLGAGAPFEGELPAYHLFQPAGKETMAPLMARDISCTRSITQGRIDRAARTGTLRYSPVAGTSVDWGQFAERHVLELSLNNPR